MQRYLVITPSLGHALDRPTHRLRRSPPRVLPTSSTTYMVLQPLMRSALPQPSSTLAASRLPLTTDNTTCVALRVFFVPNYRCTPVPYYRNGGTPRASPAPSLALALAPALSPLPRALHTLRLTLHGHTHLARPLHCHHHTQGQVVDHLVT